MTRRAVDKHVDPSTRLAMSPRTAAESIGVGYETVLKWIHDGEIAAIKIGRGYIIHVKEWDRYLDQLLAEARREAGIVA